MINLYSSKFSYNSILEPTRTVTTDKKVEQRVEEGIEVP